MKAEVKADPTQAAANAASLGNWQIQLDDILNKVKAVLNNPFSGRKKAGR